MGIPLFLPSTDFLTTLHIKHHILQDRTWHHWKVKGYGYPVHPTYNGGARLRPVTENATGSSAAEARPQNKSNADIILDPNNDYDERALRYWLALSDFYTLPHVVYFNSVGDLVDILERMWRYPARLQAIHFAMRVANRERLKLLLRYWRRRLQDIAEYSPHRPE